MFIFFLILIGVVIWFLYPTNNYKNTKKQIPLSEYTPKVEARDSIEDYQPPFMDSDDFVNALLDYQVCPESHPAINQWHKDGRPEIKKQREKWEIEFDKYFPIYEEAINLKEDNPKKALQLFVSILNRFTPIGTAYYTEPASLFCKLCKYDEAMLCIEKGVENMEKYDFTDNIESIKEEKDIFEKVLIELNPTPGILQSNIYKKINVNGYKGRFVILNMEYSKYLIRKEYKNTYKLYPANKDINFNKQIDFYERM